MVLTEEDENKFQQATHCHICKLPFSNGRHPNWKNWAVDSKKVRDHDHLVDGSVTGSNYRGAAHSACNLVYNYGWEHKKMRKRKLNKIIQNEAETQVHE